MFFNRTQSRLISKDSSNQQSANAAAHGKEKVSDMKFNPIQLQNLLRNPSFDVPMMTQLLDHDNHEMRSDFR